MGCKVTGRARAHLPREEKIDTNDPRCQWWESLKPAPLRGGREPQGSPEALDKSPGVVFHAEFDFQVKTSQYMVKMIKNTDFIKKQKQKNKIDKICIFGHFDNILACFDLKIEFSMKNSPRGLV